MESTKNISKKSKYIPSPEQNYFVHFAMRYPVEYAKIQFGFINFLIYNSMLAQMCLCVLQYIIDISSTLLDFMYNRGNAGSQISIFSPKKNGLNAEKLKTSKFWWSFWIYCHKKSSIHPAVFHSKRAERVKQEEGTLKNPLVSCTKYIALLLLFYLVTFQII